MQLLHCCCPSSPICRFSEEDEGLRGASRANSRKWPTSVEGLYEHLFEWSYSECYSSRDGPEGELSSLKARKLTPDSFSAKEPFTHRNTGFEGALKSIDELSLDDPQMGKWCSSA